MSAADTTRESLEGYGTPSSYPSLVPDTEATQACDECYRRKTKCHSSHILLPVSPIVAGAGPSAKAKASATSHLMQNIASSPAPSKAPVAGVSAIRQPTSNVRGSINLGPINNIFGVQSRLPLMAAQVSPLALDRQPQASSTHATRMSTTAEEPVSPFPSSSTGTGNHSSLIVTLHINAANVPAHLKAMPSQGNPNGSASAPASAPTAAAAASRAPSAAPTTSAMPAEAAEHGAATRVYMNTKVTYHLLVGMKELAKHKPDNPLRFLGEFLLARSAQYETGPAAATPGAASAPPAAAVGDDNAMDDE